MLSSSLHLSIFSVRIAKQFLKERSKVSLAFSFSIGVSNVYLLMIT